MNNLNVHEQKKKQLLKNTKQPEAGEILSSSIRWTKLSLYGPFVNKARVIVLSLSVTCCVTRLNARRYTGHV